MLVLEHFQILARIYAIPIERCEEIGARYGSQPQLKTLEHDVQFECNIDLSDCRDCRRQHCANTAEIQRAINSRRNAASGHVENHKHLPHSAENLASELIRLPLPEQKLGINKPELVDQIRRSV